MNTSKNEFIQTRSYIYSKEIPDVRDGLTSLQRKLLAKVHKATMDGKRKRTECIISGFNGEHFFNEMLPRSAFGASAKIYDVILNMVQTWKNPTLLQSGGNFGNVGFCYGDFADPRYNEIKLSEYANILFDIKNQTLDEDATVFFSCLPNALVSGTDGTMCSIPPHNLGEIIDAIVALVKNPNLSEDELLRHIKGPDFADGGVIINKSELALMYKTGVGNIRVRGEVDVKHDETGRPHLLISKLPFTLIPMFKCVGPHCSIEKIKDIVLDEYPLLYDSMKIENRSSRDTVCIDISLKKRCNVQDALDALFLHSNVEGNYEYRAILLSHGTPKLMSLYEMLCEWLNFYREKCAEYNSGTPLTESEICSKLLDIKTKFAMPRKTEIIDI